MAGGAIFKNRSSELYSSRSVFVWSGMGMKRVIAFPSSRVRNPKIGFLSYLHKLNGGDFEARTF